MYMHEDLVVDIIERAGIVFKSDKHKWEVFNLTIGNPMVVTADRVLEITRRVNELSEDEFGGSRLDILIASGIQFAATESLTYQSDEIKDIGADILINTAARLGVDPILLGKRLKSGILADFISAGMKLAEIEIDFFNRLGELSKKNEDKVLSTMMQEGLTWDVTNEFLNIVRILDPNGDGSFTPRKDCDHRKCMGTCGHDDWNKYYDE